MCFFLALIHCPKCHLIMMLMFSVIKSIISNVVLSVWLHQPRKAQQVPWLNIYCLLIVQEFQVVSGSHWESHIHFAASLSFASPVAVAAALRGPRASHQSGATCFFDKWFKRGWHSLSSIHLSFRDIDVVLCSPVKSKEPSGSQGA